MNRFDETKEKELRKLKIKIRGAESLVINKARDVCIDDGTVALEELRQAVAELDELYEQAYERFGLEY